MVLAVMDNADDMTFVTHIRFSDPRDAAVFVSGLIGEAQMPINNGKPFCVKMTGKENVDPLNPAWISCPRKGVIQVISLCEYCLFQQAQDEITLSMCRAEAPADGYPWGVPLYITPSELRELMQESM